MRRPTTALEDEHLRVAREKARAALGRVLEQQEKAPVQASKIFAAMTDKVEGSIGSYLGVIGPALAAGAGAGAGACADGKLAELYAAVRLLLKKNLEMELAETLDKTREALVASAAGEPADMKLSTGTAVTELIELAEKIDDDCDLGRGFLRQDLVSEARMLVKQIGYERADSWRLLWRIVRPEIPSWSFSMFIFAAAEAYLSIIITNAGSAVDALKKPNGLVTFRRKTLQFFGSFSLFLLVKALASIMKNKSELKIGAKLKAAVMRNILRQDTEYFDINDTGVLQQRLEWDTADLTSKALTVPQTIISSALSICVSTVDLYRRDKKVAAFTLAVAVGTMLIQQSFTRVLTRLGEKSMRIAELTSSSSTEVFQELRSVRDATMEPSEAKRFCDKIERSNEVERVTQNMETVVGTGLYAVFTASWCVTMLFSSPLVTSGKMDTAEFMITTGLVNHTVGQLQSLVSTVPQVASGLLPAARILELLGRESRIEPSPTSSRHPGLWGQPERRQGEATGSILKGDAPGRALSAATFDGSIEFKDVKLTYPTMKEKRVLTGLSFKASAGQKVALVGAAGCGKSSVIRLVQRFYARDPGGSIAMDGIPIEDYDVHQLRRLIAVVAQETVMFSETIRENIVYGCSGQPTEEEVIAACKKANAWEFISEFPDGLDTWLGEGEHAVKLSGGQKQRIAITRAMMRRPKVLLLDEATSALDAKNEKVVQRSLDNLLREVRGVALVIAHRLTTIRNCDKIVVMDRGAKVEEGTHDELMQLPIERKTGPDGTVLLISGAYRDLWETAMRSDDIATPAVSE